MGSLKSISLLSAILLFALSLRHNNDIRSGLRIDYVFDYHFKETKNNDTNFNNGTIYYPHNNRNDTLPHFVLHVGPPKTGTTAIQHEFGKKYMKKLLQHDNYTYIGYNQGVLDIKRLLTMNKTDGKHRFSNEFITEINKQGKLGNNVFGSSEYLRTPTSKQCEAWTGMFQNGNDEGSNFDGQWDLQVVIVYRRLHRYIVSEWNQMNKLYRDGNGEPIYMGHWYWPGVNDDIRIPSFEEWFMMHHYKSTNINKSTHKAKLSYNSWKACSNKISLINYHNEDLIANFVCNALTGATHTCSVLINDEDRSGKGSVANGSSDLNYDMLAVYAYENGFVDESYNRHQVSHEIEKYVRRNSILLPQKCPNATMLDYLYNWSLESEMWAFSVMEQTIQRTKMDNRPEKKQEIAIHPLNEERLFDFQSDWELSLREGEYCNVDVSETMKQKRWQKFFANRFGYPE